MTDFTVAITDDLEIGFFAVGDADPLQAKIDLQRLIDTLELGDGITLDVTGEIENHRDQDRLARVHDLTHQ